MNLYLDCEFTGLKQKTNLISIGIVSEDNRYFYAEFNDYDKSLIDDWISSNVLKKLKFRSDITQYVSKQEKILFNNYSVEIKSDTKEIVKELERWLSQFEKVEIWSDAPSYDWVLFCELFEGALKLPSNIFYLPFDIVTLFKLKNIDPDINREEFARLNSEDKHNSLWDAKVIKACYERGLND